MTNTMKTRPRAGLRSPEGYNEFTQALKETNIPRDYVQNPNVIKAMERPGKISTPRPLLADKEFEYDDTGFQDASSITPHESPLLRLQKAKKRRESTPSDSLYSPGEESIRTNRKNLRWDVLRK